MTAAVPHRDQASLPLGARRPRLLWIGAGLALGIGVLVVLGGMSVLFDVPDPLLPWLAIAVIPVVLGIIASTIRALTRGAAIVLRESVSVTLVVALMVAVYLVVVIGLGEPVLAANRGTLALSLIAALLVALLVQPVRARVNRLTARLTAGARPAPRELLNSLQARMTRSVSMDELLLSLCEQVKTSLPATSVQVLTGVAGELSLAASVPSRDPEQLSLNADERAVIGRTRAGGSRWAEVWIPSLVEPDETLRIFPVSQQGELFGLIIVRRAADSEFTEDEEGVLVDLARQVGLALRNVRLDSALQHSLTELERRNGELRESRLRIVGASNDTRRTIERNLHDGAQQHLVALAVKIGLVEQLLTMGQQDKASAMLDELRTDVQDTVREVRELAHGIYPPLLRDKGLPEALRAAASRSQLQVNVVAENVERQSPDVEAAVYFCCVEALQNAGKYAGDGSIVTCTVETVQGKLSFEVADNGAGFDTGSDDYLAGHGFVNMLDRLGALGGALTVTSAPGAGTSVHGTIPLAAVKGAS